MLQVECVVQANCYNELPTKVIDFIKKIEKTTNVPVTLIGTGERNCDIIDLRKIKDNSI